MSEFDLDAMPVDIIHVAEPKMYPIELIVGCHAFQLDDDHKNPIDDETEEKDKKYLSGRVIFEKMLDAGWVTTAIGWARGDGSPNYGHEPTVNHVLMVVMVKLKQDS